MKRPIENENSPIQVKRGHFAKPSSKIIDDIVQRYSAVQTAWKNFLIRFILEHAKAEPNLARFKRELDHVIDMQDQYDDVYPHAIAELEEFLSNARQGSKSSKVVKGVLDTMKDINEFDIYDDLASSKKTIMRASDYLNRFFPEIKELTDCFKDLNKSLNGIILSKEENPSTQNLKIVKNSTLNYARHYYKLLKLASSKKKALRTFVTSNVDELENKTVRTCLHREFASHVRDINLFIKEINDQLEELADVKEHCQRIIDLAEDTLSSILNTMG